MNGSDKIEDKGTADVDGVFTPSSSVALPTSLKYNRFNRYIPNWNWSVCF
jgi:hypothetical protein